MMTPRYTTVSPPILRQRVRCCSTIFERINPPEPIVPPPTAMPSWYPPLAAGVVRTEYVRARDAFGTETTSIVIDYDECAAVVGSYGIRAATQSHYSTKRTFVAEEVALAVRNGVWRIRDQCTGGGAA